MKTILDISTFQTVTNWSLVKQQVYGVIARMGYRGRTNGVIMYDKKYAENKDALIKNGIPHSYYFFPCSINATEAHEEAQFIINSVKGDNISFPIYLDSEISDPTSKNGRSDKLSKDVRTNLLKIILEDLTKAGIPCGVYASKSWFENQLDTKQLEKYSIWVAQYNKTLTYKGKYDMWQYTSSGSINGIANRVDLSNLYNESIIITSNKTPNKTIGQLAVEVLANKYGIGDTRKANLAKLGYSTAQITQIQNRVNEIDATEKEIDRLRTKLNKLKTE